MDEFKAGDTVRLKSGGPLMTILNIGKDGSGGAAIFVVWFDKGDEKRSSFPPSAIEKDDDSAPTGGLVFGAV